MTVTQDRHCGKCARRVRMTRCEWVQGHRRRPDHPVQQRMRAQELAVPDPRQELLTTWPTAVRGAFAPFARLTTPPSASVLPTRVARAGYTQVVADQLEALKEEIRTSADAILTAAGW
jgi:hypothetical protein